MGMHTIEVLWNITVKEPHQIVVRRNGGFFRDTLEARLDGKLVMSRPTGGLTDQKESSHQFLVDGQTLEISWRYNDSGDPAQIMLTHSNRILARYSSGDTAAHKLGLETIDSNNSIAFAQNIRIHLQPEIERRETATEGVYVPRGVNITVKRSRTIEHTVDVEWSASGGGSIDVGIQPIISASIRREFEQIQGSALKQSETIEYEVELNGEKNNRYKLVWTDIWRRGVVEFHEGDDTWLLPFCYRERAELEVCPVDSSEVS